MSFLLLNNKTLRLSFNFSKLITFETPINNPKQIHRNFAWLGKSSYLRTYKIDNNIQNYDACWTYVLFIYLF